jgi:hypothetical protein
MICSARKIAGGPEAGWRSAGRNLNENAARVAARLVAGAGFEPQLKGVGI